MKKNTASQLRIIGGRWRGRKIPVPAIAGLRPTPDRIRETVFNWLAARCQAATALDCFAGSGALGFEVASRGAKAVFMVEKSSDAMQNLVNQKQRLEANNIELYRGDILALIPSLQRSLDIVFIDPPYARSELRHRVIDALITNQSLADGARIYLEWPHGERFEFLSAGFTWLKQKKAGQVHYAIAEWRLCR
ncbi:MAG: 16S rRNA (guanine(966)-N(2))-methyltransferase RsmD [Gammaproteobacteria bacterium]|nr:16S rRNA (guanine(966)-N(2))-methyltransferase RsmD [Gammaproteobacteria bacterium]